MEAKREMSGDAAAYEATLRLRIPPDPRYSREVRERVAGFAAAYRVGDNDLREFLTAIGEALANAIEHSRSTGNINVTCWIENHDHLVATIADEGIGFRAPTRVNACLPDVFAERGRGLGIMRRCSDNVTVKSSPGKGTTVTLRRLIRHRTIG